MNYQLTRGAYGWRRKEEGFTLAEIEEKAHRLGLKVRDGYGRTARSRIQRARKIVLSNGIEFRAITVDRPSRPFGPKTVPEPVE